jgi:hypothetical protein
LEQTPVPTAIDAVFIQPSPTIAVGFPPYYTPNPAMLKILSAPHEKFEENKLRWIDNQHLAILSPYKQWAEGCQTTWDVYEIAADPVSLKSTNEILNQSNLSNCSPYGNHDDILKLIKDQYQLNAYSYILFADGEFILADEITKRPVATLQGDPINKQAEDGLFDQIWLIDTVNKTKKALAYTVLEYNFDLTPDQRYLLLSQVGMGGAREPGSGFFSIDLKEKKVYPMIIEGYEGVSEFVSDYVISPNSQYLITNLDNFRGTVWRIDGSQKYAVCEKDGWPRTYTWSKDGRYVYVTCTSGDGSSSDSLRVFDTVIQKMTVLTDGKKLPFKAIALEPSPDQKKILFRWGNSFVWNTEDYGYWIIDLNKLMK